MKIKAETVIRTVILVIALVNQVLTATGHSIIPIDDDTVTQFISLAFTIGASVWAWWKNNSFTQAALKGDAMMQSEKAITTTETTDETNSDDTKEE